MRRQLTDQQRRERQLLHQQDSRLQLLKETGTKLKLQTAAVRGGYDYTEYKRPGHRKGKPASKEDVKSLSPYKLPVVGSKKRKTQKKSLRLIQYHLFIVMFALNVICLKQASTRRTKSFFANFSSLSSATPRQS